ncbi:MAG TPA: hypothetical protein VI074_11955, partial [Propionibacteriaceae bacterium]
VVLFVVFIVVERRVRDPLINLSLFRNRAFVLITVGGGAVLLAITLFGRRTRRAAEVASPAS